MLVLLNREAEARGTVVDAVGEAAAGAEAAA